jgi:hypothetical protein
MFPLAAGAAVLLCLVLSCKQQLLPVPVSAESGPGDALIAPGDLRASRGKKGVITLSWADVPGASRYYIYRSKSPLAEFVRCGETAEAVSNFEFGVPPGDISFFRVAALNYRNEISPQSDWAGGASLARPEISDVIEDPDNPGTRTVFWYMNNAAPPSTYDGGVRYTVFCLDGDVVIARLESSEPDDTRIVFTNLPPPAAGGSYAFRVEVSPEDDQDAREAGAVWRER